MRRFTVLLASIGSSLALAQGPFVDVSPCHWATPAVNRIAGTPQVDEAQARTSSYLAENSLVQVFEGLRCGDLAWSVSFMVGTPAGTVPSGVLSSFELVQLATRLEGDSGTVSFQLNAVIDGAPVERSGSAELVFLEKRWRVDYGSLASLDLPLFP